MTVTVYDNFSGTQATLAGRTPDTTNTPGNTWSAASGTWEVNGSGAAVKTATNESIQYAVIDAAETDGELTAEYYSGSDSYAGVVFRYLAANDHFALLLEDAENAFNLYEHNGSYVSRASSSVTITTNTTYTIFADWSGTTIDATLDGGNAINYTSLGNGTATTVGITQWRTSTSRHNYFQFDDGAAGGPNVSDSTTVTDTATLFTDQLHRSVSDSAGVSDAPSLSVSQNALTISVSDTTNVCEGWRPLIAVPQTARPTSDVTSTNWTSSSGTDEYAMLDETTADDADYATTSTQDAGLEVALGSLTDPVSSTGHIVRLRARSLGSGGAEKQTVLLLQGATTIATVINNANLVRTTWTATTYTLSGAEADAITNYADLRLRFTAGTLGGTESYQVSWAEFEVPGVVAPMHAFFCIGDNAAVSDSPTVSVQAADGTRTVNVSDSATVADSAPVVLAEPLVTEWSSYRRIIELGTSSEWDYIFWGGAGGKPVKVSGTYYFYYCGSDNGDEDNGDSNRSIGLATSTNFLTWTKHASNPLITYTTTGGVETEEGATNPVVLVDGATWHMWYAASRYNGTPGQVDVDVRYCTSTDGITWTGDALVYTVSGEEHKPVGVLKISSTYYLYGMGNLVSGRGPLWVMSGTDPAVLSGKTEVLAGTWFNASLNDLNADIVSVALYETDYELQWRRIERATPTAISAQIGTTLTREAGYSAPSYLMRDGTLWREIGLQTSGTDYYAYRHSPASLDAYDNAASDSATVSDAPTLAALLAGISVSDSAAVADTPILLVTELFVSASDSATVADAPTVQAVEAGQTIVNVSDSATVADAPTVDVLLAGVAVADSASVADAPSLTVVEAGQTIVNVSDSASLTDAPSLDVILAGINAADSASIADAPTVAAILAGINVSDSSAVSDAPGLLLANYALSVSDSTSVVDAPAVSVVLAGISVTESITVTDSVSVVQVEQGIYAITIAESVTLSETLTVAALLGDVLVSDSITTSETVTRALSVEISASDSATLGEVLALAAQLAGISVADNVSLAESVALLLDPLLLSVSDSATVGEAITLARDFVGINVSDGITVSDIILMFVGLIVTPDSRIYAVAQDNRIFAAARDNRTYAVARDDRTWEVSS